MTNQLNWVRLKHENTSTMLVILTTFVGILLARVLAHPLWVRNNLFVAYLMEFSVIILPTVLVVSVARKYCALVLLVLFLISVSLTLRWGCRWQPWNRSESIHMEGRSIVLTIVRGITFLITAICILAVDFKSFHRPHRKSRFYGASLMDTGIGLFVAVMGLVSRRTQNWPQFRRILIRSVCPLIVLGFVRVVFVQKVGYHQDDHEYGKHLNAFFVIGLSKLFGSLFSLLVNRDAQLLPIALVLLAIHQSILSFGGISKYVMDRKLPRSNLLTANREGISAQLGFVVIYLLCICLGKWFLRKEQLSSADMLERLRQMLLLYGLDWLLVGICAYFVGISRVTCNVGYILWMLAITGTMTALSLLVFELVMPSMLPLVTKTELSEYAVISQPKEITVNGVYILCESINLNGLTFFLLANLVTAFVNLYMKPESYSNMASLVILFLYMLFISFAVYKLYINRIRIA